MVMAIKTRADAFAFLHDLGAPTRLVRHVELVGEAADALLLAFTRLGVRVDGDFVRVGVVLHDVGKIVYQDELSNPGAKHESAGERLLLERGVSAQIARVCRSHAQWSSLDSSLEELIIALADKLWKGVRVGMPCRTEPAGLWVEGEPGWCASIALRNEPLLESLFAKHLGAQEP